MKKLMIIVAMLLAGCSRGDVDESTVQYYDTFTLPKEAKVISKEKTICGTWLRWRLGDECFLSMEVGMRNGVLTKVDCP